MKTNNLVREQEREKKCYWHGFWPWLDKNEDVYQRYVDGAIYLKQRGHKRGSVIYIQNILRWKSRHHDKDGEYKLNANLTAGIARLIMAENPSLDGFFETRGRRSHYE